MDKNKQVSRFIKFGLIATACMILVFLSVYIVRAGNVGVITRFGAVNRVVNPGIGLKVPFVEEIVTMNVRTQKVEVEASAASLNLQTVRSTIAVNFHLDGTQAVAVYQNIGTKYVDIILSPAIQNTFKSVTAQFTAEQLINSRETVRVKAEKELYDRLLPYHIIIEAFNIINFDFSPEFNAAIEQKQVKQQEVETAKQELAKAEIQAQQALAVAQGQANAVFANAEGTAKAQQVLRENGALTPEYLQYLFLTTWDGELPVVMGTGTNIMDISPFVNK